MRLDINNCTRLPDSRVQALTEYCAQFISGVTGTVRATFREMRSDASSPYDGYCSYWKKSINVRVSFAGDWKPIKFDHLGYFAHHRIEITPYTMETREESILHITAHELAHCMPRGHRHRKSRIEVWCEEKATEVLHAYRTPEGQQWINDRQRQIETELADRANRIAQRKADRNSPEFKLARLEAQAKRWQTKLKRATTALRQIAKRQRYYAKKIELTVTTNEQSTNN